LLAFVILLVFASMLVLVILLVFVILLVLVILPKAGSPQEDLRLLKAHNRGAYVPER